MTRSLDQALLQGADVSAMANMNLLVNGFHNVSQENGANTVTATSNKYATDQWVALKGGAAAYTLQQVTSPFPSQPDVPYGLKLAITTAEAAPAAATLLGVYQPLEGLNLARLLYGAANARPVTLAFLVRPSVALTGYFALNSLNSSLATLRSFVHRFVLQANVDNFVTFTIPGDQVQSLLTTNVFSLQASWIFSSGTNYQTATLDQWQSGNFLAGTDVTNLAATVGNNVILSGAVMFPGIVPISQAMLPLLARQYDDELRKCQRHFYAPPLPPGYFHALSGAFGYQQYSIPLPVRMRTVPSVTGWAVSVTGGGSTNTGGATGAAGTADLITIRNDVTNTSTSVNFTAPPVFNARM